MVTSSGTGTSADTGAGAGDASRGWKATCTGGLGTMETAETALSGTAAAAADTTSSGTAAAVFLALSPPAAPAPLSDRRLHTRVGMAATKFAQAVSFL